MSSVLIIEDGLGKIAEKKIHEEFTRQTVRRLSRNPFAELTRQFRRMIAFHSITRKTSVFRDGSVFGRMEDRSAVDDVRWVVLAGFRDALDLVR